MDRHTLAAATKNANRKAIRRDVKTRKDTIPDLAAVAEEERKANALGWGLHRIKDISNVAFTQTINENCFELNRIRYLTSAENTLIFKLLPIVGYGSNAL